MKDHSQFVQHEIFREGFGTFAILDGASIPALQANLKEWHPEFECLYRGELQPDLQEVAPYLVRIEPPPGFGEWLLDFGWGQHWGVFVVADADLRTLRQHFRRFLTVHDEKGKPLLFRYYDPRVLRAYLPTCNAVELAEFFGPVAGYVLEDQDPSHALLFERASTDGSLVSKTRHFMPKK